MTCHSGPTIRAQNTRVSTVMAHRKLLIHCQLSGQLPPCQRFLSHTGREVILIDPKWPSVLCMELRMTSFSYHEVLGCPTWALHQALAARV